MSIKYGCNGNDLNWEYVECLVDICASCCAYMREYGIKELPDDYECDGHVHVYHRSEEHNEVYKMMMDYNDTRTILEITPFAIVHDTNGNFVTLLGDVPDKYLTDTYIKEREELNELIYQAEETYHG